MWLLLALELKAALSLNPAAFYDSEHSQFSPFSPFYLLIFLSLANLF